MWKWAIDWQTYGQSPPSLLNVLISMFMSPGVYTEPGRIFEGQEHVQLVLVLVAVLAVPFLLLPKPLLFLLDRRAQARAEASDYRSMSLEPAAEEGGSRAEVHEEDEEDDFSEVLVHQVIHTIEFVLGSISNTASYLRLWALSLAHSQLSELFWDKVVWGTHCITSLSVGCCRSRVLCVALLTGGLSFFSSLRVTLFA
jgi:V-type H+-transporting ATPase subunit a